MSDAQFEGAGGPPPKSNNGGGGRGNQPEFGFEEPIQYTAKDGQVKTAARRIHTWRLQSGEQNRPCLLLDRLGKRRSTYIHGPFTGRDGRFGSMLVSPYRTRSDDPGPDPLIEPLKLQQYDPSRQYEPSWYWVVTCIDLTPYVSEKTGKTHISRKLVLITDKQKQQFLTVEKMGNGLRGNVFNGGRTVNGTDYAWPANTPKNKRKCQTFRIGDVWDFTEKLTEEQMLERFKEAAEVYGMPVEEFIEPCDYEAIFDDIKPYNELQQIANDLMKTQKARSNVKVAGESATAEAPSEGEVSEEALPF